MSTIKDKRVIQNIIQHTGIAKNPLRIRDHIRRFAKDESEKTRLLKDYNRLLQEKPTTKHELRVFLKELGNKGKFHITGTYLHTIAHNPDDVMKHAERTVRAERHKEAAEQRIHGREQEKLEKEQEKEEIEKAKKAAEINEVTPAHHGHEPQTKEGREPVAAHYTDKDA
ncbi:hypothetical protein HY623_02480 [Candidatus Uhrbacteria bacterium]|nr:hypothetical protein [Candidatus Uhrbacteria bacterium]